jgi:redox-sensing transcriptional repressor
LPRKISESTVHRLSLYLRILEEVKGPRGTVSSEDLAERAGTTAAQVRKDLSLFGSFGKRGLGYSVPELSGRLREILGLDREWRVALVGAGRVGAALFEYPGFRKRGFQIVSVLDRDPEKVGRKWGQVTIEPVSRLEDTIRERNVEIVILAVPAPAVQEVVDRAVHAGVRAILNFAPAQVRVPEDVALKDVNMVMELEALSFTLSQNPGSR